MKLVALILLGFSVVALTLLLMVAPRRHQNRIACCLSIVAVMFLIACYYTGQGAW